MEVGGGRRESRISVCWRRGPFEGRRKRRRSLLRLSVGGKKRVWVVEA